MNGDEMMNLVEVVPLLFKVDVNFVEASVPLMIFQFVFDQFSLLLTWLSFMLASFFSFIFFLSSYGSHFITLAVIFISHNSSVNSLIEK